MTPQPIGADDITVRSATTADDGAVLALLRDTLGKRPEDPYETFFHWKHRENPFGRSPAWLAEHEHRVVGYRTFLRWEFTSPQGARIRAVRAVDTATHRDFRGRGIFQRLTLAALDDRLLAWLLPIDAPVDLAEPVWLGVLVAIVAIGLALMVLALIYAELLRRYGTPAVVGSVLDLVDWTSARIGAFPRPLVALLGIPALTWGTFMRARRRQGWWVCAFGVAATVPMATSLLDPGSSFVEAALRCGYSLAVGLALGYLLIRGDLFLTAPRGVRGRRAEEAQAHRPEPARFSEL